MDAHALSVQRNVILGLLLTGAVGALAIEAIGARAVLSSATAARISFVLILAKRYGSVVFFKTLRLY